MQINQLEKKYIVDSFLVVQITRNNKKSLLLSFDVCFWRVNFVFLFHVCNYYYSFFENKVGMRCVQGRHTKKCFLTSVKVFKGSLICSDACQNEACPRTLWLFLAVLSFAEEGEVLKDISTSGATKRATCINNSFVKKKLWFLNHW